MNVDIEYLLLLQSFREATGGSLDKFMAYITTYGDELRAMMIAAAIYWCVDKKQGVFTMFAWGASILMNGFLKVTACVYRPWIRDARVIPVDGAKAGATGYSFPSGTATNAAALFGGIAMNDKITKALRALMILMVLLVGFSRNYLGVHTPQDVLTGCGATVAILFFVRWLLEKADKSRDLDVIILIVGIILNICVMIYAGEKSYPMDYDADGKLIVDPARMAIDTYKSCGFSLAVIISWFIDRRWLKYRPEGSALDRAACYTAGILGYFVVLYAVIPLLPANAPGYVLDRFVRLVYVMLIVPFAISRFKH